MKPPIRHIIVAVLILIAGAVLLDTLSSPDEAVAVSEVVAERAADDSATKARRARRLRARRDRRLNGLLKRTVGEQRTVTVNVQQCRDAAADGVDVTVLVAGRPVSRGRTDTEGRFEARVPRDAVVTALAVGGPLEGGSEPTQGDALSVNICPGAEVLGRVLDGRGNPLADITVSLGDGQDVAVTDADGTFLLTDLQLTASAVTATGAGGHVVVSIQALEPGEQRALDLTLEYGRRLVGWVVDSSGAGVPYATVSAIDYADRELLRVRSDRAGRFWLKKMPHVDLLLVADTGNGSSGRLQVGPAETRDDLMIRVEPSGALVVQYTGPGSPRFSVGVPDLLSADADYETVTVVAAGEVAQLSAPRRYTVFFTDGEGAERECGTAFVTPGEQAVVSCGEAGEGVVTGRVVDASGTPLQGISVMARAVESRGAVGIQNVTDADGRFAMTFVVEKSTDIRLTVGQRRSEFLQSRRRNFQVGPNQKTDLGDIRLDRYEDLADLFPSGPFGGIGGQVDETDDGILLARIVKGGPLDEAGLTSGDIILGIDGDDTVGQLTAGDAVRLLRGPEGSSVSIRVRRASGEVMDVDVARRVIDVKSSGWVN